MAILRAKIINHLIDVYGYKSYLEIGVNEGFCFREIKIEHKDGVDPEGEPANFAVTSDEFFANNSRTYDIVFVDGFHEWRQCRRDILNSLEILNKGGTIVVHDLLPTTKKCQMVPRISDRWNGNVWKAWARLRSTRKDLSMWTVDVDHGTGIIRRGEQKLYPLPAQCNFGFFKEHRDALMNTISLADFFEEFSNYDE